MIISNISSLFVKQQLKLKIFTMICVLLTFVLFAATSAAPAGPPHPGPGPKAKHAPLPLAPPPPHKRALPPPPPPHPAPAPKHLPGPGPKYHPGPGPKHHPMPYAYTYGVTDEYHGVDFGETKESDGNVVHGSYHVLLPDCRVQHVKYTADHYGGYVAEVSYDGPAPHCKPPVHAKPAPYHPPPPHHA